MITMDDLVKYKQFKAVVVKCKLEIQGEAAIPVALLFDWFNKLEDKLEKQVKSNEPKEIKNVTAPIKKIGK